MLLYIQGCPQGNHLLSLYAKIFMKLWSQKQGAIKILKENSLVVTLLMLQNVAKALIWLDLWIITCFVFSHTGHRHIDGAINGHSDGHYLSTFPVTREAIDCSTAKKYCLGAVEYIFFQCALFPDSLAVACAGCIRTAAYLTLACEVLLSAVWFVSKKGALDLSRHPTVPTFLGLQ